MSKRIGYSPERIVVLFALFNFFISSCMGLIMRYAFVWEATWMKYKNIMYAHSHGALLGWLYIALSILLWKFVDENSSSKFFPVLLTLSEISFLGMVFSFSFQGYDLVSSCCVLSFILITYFISYKLWKKVSGKSGPDILLYKTSLVWMVVSSLGIWAMIPILTEKITTLFYMAIQFFLHFQLNGWLLFAVLALFFNQLKKSSVTFSASRFRLFYILLVAATLLTFALAVSWANPDSFIFYTNSIGVITQLLALIVFFTLIPKEAIRKIKYEMSSFTLFVYKIAFISFVLKILVQTLVVWPQIAVISYTIRLYVLGFIHLITIGAITFFVLAHCFTYGYLSYKNSVSQSGWLLLIAGFLITEFILFAQGTTVWLGYGYVKEYHLIIFVSSILFPLGILLALTGQFFNSTKLNINK